MGQSCMYLCAIYHNMTVVNMHFSQQLRGKPAVTYAQPQCINTHAFLAAVNGQSSHYVCTVNMQQHTCDIENAAAAAAGVDFHGYT